MTMPDFSENNLFAIDGDELYAQSSSASVRGHTVSSSSTKRFAVGGSRTRTTYYLVESNQKYFRDCLETAEDLMNNSYPSSIASSVRSKVRRTGTDFGASDSDNRSAAASYASTYSTYADKKADPSVGQAYVIVSRSASSTYPYHAAGVIAEDGDSRITLEVFASGVDATSRTEDGGYKIYSSSSTSGKTFHDAWSSHAGLRTSTSGAPNTIVIEKK